MMIIEFNPQNLKKVFMFTEVLSVIKFIWIKMKEDIEIEMKNVKSYFTEGNGRDCKLTSLYFHIL